MCLDSGCLIPSWSVPSSPQYPLGQPFRRSRRLGERLTPGQGPGDPKRVPGLSAGEQPPSSPWVEEARLRTRQRQQHLGAPCGLSLAFVPVWGGVCMGRGVQGEGQAPPVGQSPDQAGGQRGWGAGGGLWDLGKDPQPQPR